MEEVEIKHEFDVKGQLQCRTCLSIGRKLTPLGKYAEIYQKLVSDFVQPCLEQMQVCWECLAILSRVLTFQKKVQNANRMLQIGQAHIYGSLSSLSTITYSDTHPHTIYVTDNMVYTKPEPNIDIENIENTFDNAETFSEDVLETKDILKIEKERNVDIKKKKTNNKWAKKRAIQNKKPKFKIISSKNLKMEEMYFKNKIVLEDLLNFMKRARVSEYFKKRKFKCEDCVLCFKSEKATEEHIRSFHEKTIGPYKCDICTSRFSSKRHLVAHISKHYYSYCCKLCNCVCLNKNMLRRHIESHTKVFSCLKCKLKFCARRDFFKHYKEWHEKFICDYCGISFKMRYCIKDHIRKQHSPYECTPCGKRFARYNGLWLHNKTAHASGRATSAYCVECDTEYRDAYRYRWHLANSARHTPPKKRRIPCPGCDKVFSKNIYMKDHYNLVHLKHYKYRCEECDKNFIRNADLVKHKRRVHEGILPPKNKICYMCGRGFTTNKILTNHVRTHTGERPFACAACPARFAQSAALIGHVRALHPGPPHR